MCFMQKEITTSHTHTHTTDDHKLFALASANEKQYVKVTMLEHETEVKIIFV